jgi:hypothetical protein
MTALVDDLGLWVQLGEIVPSWDWITFPVSTSTTNSIFRLTTLTDDFNAIKTFNYIRVVYLSSGTNFPDNRWQRFYPKEGSEIIDLNTNPLFLFSNVSRLIEVRKSSRWYGYRRPISDNLYRLRLEEFVPFDNVLNNASNLPQLTDAINSLLEQFKDELTQDLITQIEQLIQAQLPQTINQQVNQAIQSEQQNQRNQAIDDDTAGISGGLN